MPDRETTLRDLESLGAWHTHHYTPFHYEAAETIHNALAMLLEQEPVKPEWRQGKPSCGACGTILLYKVFRQNYCHFCGRAVKWDA